MRNPWDKPRAMWSNLTTGQKEAVLTWFWFSAALGLVPVLIAYGSHLLVGANSQPVRHGDVLLLAAVLCFVGVGEMFRAGGRIMGQRVVGLGGGTVVLGAVNAILFAVVSASAHPHTLSVDIFSALLYLVSALCSVSCVVLAGGGGGGGE